MEDIYDVIVIGSGPSGRTASSRLAKNGISVALVDDCKFTTRVLLYNGRLIKFKSTADQRKSRY